ncbi:hypothetical protein OG413_16970 [Streptomyces sp. NBC_01433]|uniref:hypothetical protein n=1 Tax=Streptomyces sp. NBC_01433 TaxID=2903864 RepID=UPI002256A377|nr:hypothetical protein [Streptomyces sp. NBC_01433]MCX4676974.1 hypothetical protein [Streptomyces sp. NBC_01433]
MSEEEIHLLSTYESIQDPQLRSDFLDAIGTTRPRIEHLRRLRDAEAARNAAKDAQESESNGSSTHERRRQSRRRLRRTPRHSEVNVTRPPNKGDIRRMPPRRRRRIVLVIIIELD